MKKLVSVSFVLLILLSVFAIQLVVADSDGDDNSRLDNDDSDSGSKDDSNSREGDNPNKGTSGNEEKDRAEIKAGIKVEERAKADVKKEEIRRIKDGDKIEIERRIEKREGEIRERLKEKIENEEERKERIEEFREKLKEKDGKIEIEGRKIEIKEDGEKGKVIVVGKIKAKTDIDLIEGEEGKGKRLRAILSNGRFADVRVMPESASVVALKKLKARCEEDSCKIELKEVGEKDNVKLKYKIKTKKEGRLLFLFKLKMDVNSEVDAETGEVKISKPWWAFLVNEVEVSNEEIEETIEEEGDETDVDVEGDVAPNVELQGMVNELVSSLKESVGEVELELEIEKEDGKVEVESEAKGSLNEEQQNLWHKIQNLTKTIIENVEGDVKLKIKVKHKIKEEEEVEESEIDENETEIERNVSNKVVICHIPGGNVKFAVTLKVGRSAVKAHLAHGDYLGECKKENVGGKPGNETVGNDTVINNTVPPIENNITANVNVSANVSVNSSAEVNVSV